MGLFRKKEKEKEQVQVFEAEKSLMLAIPEGTNHFENLDQTLSLIQDSELIEFIEAEEGDRLKIRFSVEDIAYEAFIWANAVEIPQMYNLQHFFPDVDMEKIAKANMGLMVEMVYAEEALMSYHAQLKLITAMMPNVLAVLDISAEKILSGRWVSMAAWSKVAPSPRYLFTVQAVSGKGKEVWLHSHGLNRCGLPELEILNSDKETYETHYNIVENTAKRLLDMDEKLPLKEHLYLAMVTNEIPLMVTLVHWREAIENYKKNILGGKRDRDEAHSGNTCCIFCYTSPDNLEKKKYEPVMVYDELLSGNPLYMLTNEETARMKALALERLALMKKKIGAPETTILVKIGLEVDEEFKEDGNSREHIWFELNDAQDGQVTATLTQEPYYIKDLHEGAVRTYPEGDITDWIVFADGERYSPDDAYLMVTK